MATSFVVAHTLLSVEESFFFINSLYWCYRIVNVGGMTVCHCFVVVDAKPKSLAAEYALAMN